jgi:putative flippase GtrA
MIIGENTMRRQFSSFVVAGLITTVFQYAILVSLVEFNLLQPVHASVWGAIGGAVLSYYLNRKYTFRSNAAHKNAVPRFFTVAALAIISNALLMFLFVRLLHIPYIPAQIITTGAIIPITFGLNRIWSFATTD